MKERKHIPFSRAFTIVELVIVIAVIGILAAVLIPTFSSIINASKESKALSEVTSSLKVISTEIDLDKDIYFLYYEDEEVQYIFEYKNRELKIKEYETIDQENYFIYIDSVEYVLLDLSNIKDIPENIKVCAINDKIYPDSIAITGENTVEVNKIITLKAKVTPNESTENDLIWTINNSNIAEINIINNETIYVKGLAKGEAVIKATSKYYDNIYYEFNISVIDEITYTISYDLDGGICNNLPEEFSETNMITLPTPTKEGYKFLGWYDENDKLINTLELKNYNLKAKWEINKYKVTFIIDNFGNDDSKIEVIYEYNQVITEPNNPVREGYTFEGWYRDDKYINLYDFKETIKDNITLYAKFELKKPDKILVNPSEKNEFMYVGYEKELSPVIYPNDATKEVIWELHSSSISKAIIENNKVKALAAGQIKVRAVSKHYPDIKSEYYTIEILNEPSAMSVSSLNGYQIVIMAPYNSFDDIDPFLENYSKPDRLAKQKAWAEVESKYNCDIVVKEYSPSATFAPYSETLKYEYANGRVACDIAYFSNFVISDLANEGVIKDLTDYYDNHHLDLMSVYDKDLVTYKNKIYASKSEPYKYLNELDNINGLFYNYGWLKELGVESPAKLFNEGKWNYTGFTNWVLELQAKLGENEYVLGGHPYYYYLGMTVAAGETVANIRNLEVNILNDRSKDAASLIYSLTEKGAVNTSVTWAETNDISNSFFKTDGGGTLMVPGYQWFVKNDGRWQDDMWGEGTTEFGYVPFPYPDDLSKEETRIYNDTQMVYVYPNGRNYPEEIANDAQKNIWYIMQETLSITKKYISEEEVKDSLKEELNNKYSDKNSTEAILHFYDLPFIYEPLSKLSPIMYISPITNASTNTFYKGKDFNVEFESIYDELKSEFEAFYGK